MDQAGLRSLARPGSSVADSAPGAPLAQSLVQQRAVKCVICVMGLFGLAAVMVAAPADRTAMLLEQFVGQLPMERSGLVAACVGRHDVGPFAAWPRRGHVRRGLQPGSSRGHWGTRVCTCLPGGINHVCCALVLTGHRVVRRTGCVAWPERVAMVSGALPGFVRRLSRSHCCSCERWAVRSDRWRGLGGAAVRR